MQRRAVLFDLVSNRIDFTYDDLLSRIAKPSEMKTLEEAVSRFITGGCLSSCESIGASVLILGSSADASRHLWTLDNDNNIVRCDLPDGPNDARSRFAADRGVTLIREDSKGRLKALNLLGGAIELIRDMDGLAVPEAFNAAYVISELYRESVEEGWHISSPTFLGVAFNEARNKANFLFGSDRISPFRLDDGNDSQLVFVPLDNVGAPGVDSQTRETLSMFGILPISFGPVEFKKLSFYE